MRQLLVVLFTALLSPAIRALPALPAAAAGEAGWLSALAALPVALLLAWMLCRLLADAGEGEGLAERVRALWGGFAGGTILLLYLLWGLLLLAANTRIYGQRMLSTGYRNTSLWFFMAVLLAAALWMARGKLSAFARAGEVFYLILSLTLGAVLLLALFHVEAENVIPLWFDDALPALGSALPVLGVLGYGVFGAFLAGNVVRKRENRRRALKWTAGFCLLLTALEFVVLGNFGPGLIGRMEQPFFMAVKGIGVQGAFQRVESVVVALWVLSDLVFIGLLTFACCAVCKTLFGLREGKGAALPVTLLGLAGALLLFPDAFALDRFADFVLPWGNLLFGFLLPALLLLTAALKKRRKGHI